MKIKTSVFVKSSSNNEQCPAPDRPEYAFIGRSNVGKSSLINSLTQRRDLAKTSSKPGKTQVINHFNINNEWYLVDLPGYGYAKVSLADRKKWSEMIENYLFKRESLVCTFVLIDSRIEPQKVDLEFIEKLGTQGVPFALVFTKTDKLTANQLKINLENYKKTLLETWVDLPQIFVTSSVANQGREEILQQINEWNQLPK